MFLTDFPDSEYAPIARHVPQGGSGKTWTQGDFGVGMFYTERGITSRRIPLKEIEENYKEFSMMDEALHRLAEALEKTEKP